MTRPNRARYIAFISPSHAMTVTSIRLQAEVESGLAGLTPRLQRSRNWLINQAVREFVLRQEEGRARWQETLTALASVATGEVVSGQAVHEWLGSWGKADELTPPKVGQ